MTRIICDTMIWYNLSKGHLKVPDPEKYTLVCTYLTLMELAFTPNNFRKLTEVQDAINQILHSEPEFILQVPFDHARFLINTGIKPEFNIEEDLVFGFLRILLNQPKEGLINNDFKLQLSDITAKRTLNSNNWSDFQNKLNEPSKKMGRVLKKYYSEEWEQTRFQGWFILQLNQLSDTSYSAEQIDWRNYELYEKVYKRYQRNLKISKMKVDSNDGNDLKNMIYVQPADLYWTLEKRWLTIAKEIKLEKYFYRE